MRAANAASDELHAGLVELRALRAKRKAILRGLKSRLRVSGVLIVLALRHECLPVPV